MKPRYMIGLLAILGFLVLALMSFPSNKIDYAQIADAKESGKTVQLIGSWVKSDGANYDAAQNLFTFTLEDDKMQRIKVVHSGVRPQNFEIADKVVVKGKVEGNHFASKEILTKCPSKYEGSAEEIKNQ